MDFDIIIVGAGLAGAMAAYELINNKPDLRIAILESRDRIGGRTETDENSGIDLGGQWVGPKHSVMLELINRFGCTLVEQYYPSNKSTRLTECVGYKQQELSSDETSELDKFITMVDKMSSEINLDCPWDHPKAEEWDYTSVYDFIQTHEHKHEHKTVHSEILLFVQTVFAMNPAKISFLFFLFYIKSSGGMVSLGDGELGAQKWKVLGGLQQISQLLCFEAEKKGVKVYLNQTVDEITQSIGDESLYIHTQTNENWTCKRLILALPPQLVVGFIKFTPSLPLEKQILGNNLASGQAVKIIVEYSDSFWLKTEQNENIGPHFTELGPVHNWFHSTLKDGTTQKNETSALVGLITGDKAVEFCNINDVKRKMLVINQIEKMYPKAKTFELLSYHERLWPKEIYSGGCFVGIYNPNGHFYKYGQHIRSVTGKIHWASTETATEFYGYMEGALRSGQRVATEVVLEL